MKNPFKRTAKAEPEIKEPVNPPRSRDGRRMRRMVAQMFKASMVDNQTDGWGGVPVPPDVYITMRQMVLVARSREQWSNNDHVRKFVRLCKQNIVGDKGILLQPRAKKPRGDADQDARAAITLAWDLWGRRGNCDVTGRYTWRQIQALCVETTARDGEFIIRKLYGREFGPHGFQLQLIDPQRLQVKYENAYYGNKGNFIRQGIEFNQYGKPVAYHFSSTAEWDSYYYTWNGKGFVRVPADEIIHGFVPEMVGQRRGLPWASTSLYRLHHNQGFADASVTNARASATKMGFIQYKDGMGPEYDDDEPLEIDAEPLGFHELPEGAEFKEFNPNYPAGEFAQFTKAMLQSAASGMGVSYPNLSGDLEGVNFSSIRQGTLDEREMWKELQQWLIEQLMIPVFEEWLKIALLSRKIQGKTGRPLPPEKLLVYGDVNWQPRRWPWVDPGKDEKAASEAMRGGRKSPIEIIQEQGRDPERVFAEYGEAIEALRRNGVPDELIDIFFGGKLRQTENVTDPDAPGTPANNDENGEPANADAD